MDRRAKKILHAVVSEYLQTGDAVGSRTLTRRHGIDLSPATVRNVMADLEDIGLLTQPHTSAGRVPTGTGLRFFIASLLKVRGLSIAEKETIRAQCGVDTHDFDAVMQRISRTLSEITQYAGVVLAPNPAQQKLHHIEFVPLTRPGEFLCILVTQQGHVENKLLKLETTIDPMRLDAIHNYLNEQLEGLSLDEVRHRVLAQLGADKNQYDGLVSAALRLGQAALADSSPSANVIVSGGANLITDGEEDPVRMRGLLQALEDKELVVRLLDEAMASEQIQVFLGAESEQSPFGDSSIVAMPYGPGERPLGAIAVVGPMRMNYGKVMSVVEFTAGLVSKLVLDR